MNAAPGVTHLPSGRPLGVKLALLAIGFYKASLSSWFGGSCRFQPTCSEYTYEAIERFGVLRGSWQGLKRLAQCHPFSRKFGFDPVPERAERTGTTAVKANGVRT